MGRRIRFIHTADMHVGAPTRGLGALTEEWAERLQTAIPEAYNRVIDAALSHEVDFVIIAGDMFDASHASFCDYQAFFEGLKKLHDAGTPSYLVTGNHDPYTTWARDIARLPESAHMLGIGVPTFELYERDGEPLCLIGGRSYYATAWPLDEGISDGITRENAVGALSETHPHANEAPFSIGIIHTGLDVDASKAASNASTLLARNIDYWACGHLHRHLALPADDNPRVVFPGCIQGRDLKESGERGCYLVELEEGKPPRIEFIPTASVTFHTIDVDVSPCETLSDAERLVKQELFRANGHDYCSEMISHVNLVGETALHGFLGREDVVSNMRKHINDACPGFFCDAIVDATRPARSREEIAEGNEVASHVLRKAEEQRNDKGGLVDYVQSTFVQRGIAIPDALGRRLGDFLEAAETLALDLLDGKDEDLGAPTAREEVARRIEARTDKSHPSNESIFHLGDQLEAKFMESRKAGEESAACEQAYRELCDLEAASVCAAMRADTLDKDIEALGMWHDDLTEVDERIEDRRDELDRLQAEMAGLATQGDHADSVGPSLLALSSQDDRILRDKLAECSEERDKVIRAADEAKDRSSASRAAYEALMEIDISTRNAGRMGARIAQTAVSIILPLAFMLAGIWGFIHGRDIGSLSFSTLGIGLVVLAFFLAAAAIVMLLRPNKDANALEKRRDDARWVMLQDKKLLDERMAEKEALNAQLKDLLARNGLDAADGSIRQALMLLDDARDERSRLAEANQRMMALEMHEASAVEALAKLESKRRDIESSAGIEEGASVRVLDAMLSAKTAERDSLRIELESSSARCADLVRTIDAAKDDRTFDRLKLDYHQLRARLRVAKHDYVVLLLAQRLLED